MVLTILWYIYSALHRETSGRSLDQEGVYVTSRSGALTKLILWGHLLTSDLDFYDDEPLNLDDDASWLMTGCFTIAIQMLLTQFHWVCRVSDLEDAEASVELPWTPDWVREWVIWVVSFMMILFHFDDMIDIMICCWHNLTWRLMMQADDSLPTRLT